MDYEQQPRSLNINSEVDLESYIAELENNKKQCASEGRYDEAESLKLKIEELKKSLKIKKRRDLEYQHMSEMENLEMSYKKETEEFNAEWDAKFNELEERSSSLEEALKEKHAKEMEELYAYLEQKLPKNVKFSKLYLELKNQEENLVKQQRYKEAGVVQKKIENLEKGDSEKWNNNKTDKIKSQTVKTAQKHLAEKNALKKKIEVELEGMRKEKDAGLERIMHKYKNRKFDLEMQQKQEKLLSENANLLKAKTATNPKFRTKRISLEQYGNNMSSKKDSFDHEYTKAQSDENHEEGIYQES